MSRAQFVNKIYLAISESIARFGCFFCVELLRFNTCESGADTELQELEAGDGSRSQQDLPGDGVFLQRRR